METTFSRLLKTHRFQARLRQPEVCRQVNEALGLSAGNPGRLTQATMSAWEVGRQKPSRAKIAQLLEIARILRIDRVELEAVLDGATSIVGMDSHLDRVVTADDLELLKLMEARFPGKLTVKMILDILKFRVEYLPAPETNKPSSK